MKYSLAFLFVAATAISVASATGGGGTGLLNDVVAGTELLNSMLDSDDEFAGPSTAGPSTGRGLLNDVVASDNEFAALKNAKEVYIDEGIHKMMNLETEVLRLINCAPVFRKLMFDEEKRGKVNNQRLRLKKMTEEKRKEELRKEELLKQKLTEDAKAEVDSYPKILKKGRELLHLYLKYMKNTFAECFTKAKRGGTIETNEATLTKSINSVGMMRVALTVKLVSEARKQPLK